MLRNPISIAQWGETARMMMAVQRKSLRRGKKKTGKTYKGY